MATSRYVEVDGVRSQLYLRLTQINKTSVTAGDPTRRPDPEIGKTLVERTAEALARFIDWFRGQPTVHPAS